jgi:hypothetical protein
LELKLAADLHQSEYREQDSLTQKTKKDKVQFEQIVTTKNKIQQIKTNLNQLIQAMNHNPSLLSRAASFWNEIPLWQKITAGVVLTVPLLIIGIMANLAALITLSIERLVNKSPVEAFTGKPHKPWLEMHGFSCG